MTDLLSGAYGGRIDTELTGGERFVMCISLTESLNISRRFSKHAYRCYRFVQTCITRWHTALGTDAAPSGGWRNPEIVLSGNEQPSCFWYYMMQELSFFNRASVSSLCRLSGVNRFRETFLYPCVKGHQWIFEG